MITQLAHVCIVVNDYDEAIKWYTEVLGLELRSDVPYGPGYRWVTVGAKGQQGAEIVLHKADPQSPDERLQVGQVSHWVFHTDDCRKEVESLQVKGVKIVREPEEMPWGVQAIFEDLYGNTFVLVEQRG